MTHDERKKARVEAALFAFIEERSAQMGDYFDREMFEQFRKTDPLGFAYEIKQMQCALEAAAKLRAEEVETTLMEKGKGV